MAHIGLVVCGVVFILYSVIVILLARERRWEWWHNAVATFIAVLAAFVIGLEIERLQAVSSMGAKRLHHLEAVESELNYLKDRFDDMAPLTVNLPLQSTTVELRITVATPTALRLAASSGLFEPNVAIQFSKVADNVDTYNMVAELALGVVGTAETGTSDFAERLRLVERQLDRVVGTLAEQCEKLLTQLAQQ